MLFAIIILAFAVTIFFIIKPFTINILSRKIEIDYALGSLIGAAIILMVGTLDSWQLLDCLAGRTEFNPYTIIILFMSLAYISISLDSTGFFEYVSLKFIKHSSGSKTKLFFSFYLLSSLITLCTSNDIVILTLTPIIFYFGKHAKISVVPYLIAEFFAANIWSMFLYIGNPTNIIVALSKGLGFYEYTYWMLLPTIAGGLICLILLYLTFRKDITGRFEIPKDINPNNFLKDKNCAISTFSIMLITMIMFILSPLLGLELWWISLVFALSLFSYDAIMAVVEKSSEEMIFYRTFKRYVYHKETKIYQFRLHMILEHMPWKIVPFLLSLFIMINSLVITGFTDIAASFISLLSSDIFTAAFSMGFLSSLSANIMNNCP